MGKTTIEWTEFTWNPITGCSVVSAGCKNCYAMKLAGTRLRHHPSRAGLTIDTGNGPVWEGHVRFNAQWLDQPLKWKRPRMIFVCAHGDLFHEKVPDEWIDKVFAVMARCPQHTFQVLTKRAQRMLDYHSHPYARASILPNVWLGVSVENQEAADLRIPLLLQTPAAVRWVSAEPLLGSLELDNVQVAPGEFQNCLSLEEWAATPDAPEVLESVGAGALIDWVVVGGESSRGARPMHPAWARSLRDQCRIAGVQFLFKQWGEFAPNWLNDDAGKKIAESEWMDRVGKKAAGRLLDGVQHDGYPGMINE